MTLTYELAKKLKDAGFPQVAKGRQYMKAPDNRIGRIKENKIEIKDDECYIPTLEELIKECGSSFFAVYVNLTKTGYAARTHIVENKIAEGETPEEAVSYLYLALHVDKPVDSG